MANRQNWHPSEEEIEMDDDGNKVIRSNGRQYGEDHHDDTVSTTKDNEKKSDIVYDIDTAPPWYLAMALGFQHYLTMFGATIAIPFILAPLLCIADDDPAKGYIMSTMFYVSGLITLLQATFGNRLPIVQGGTFSFVVPAIALLNQPNLKCPDTFTTSGGWSEAANKTEEQVTEEWQFRMRELQGAIAVSSIVQIALGFSGLTGILLRFVTPLTIAPAVAMIGISLFEPASFFASGNWGVSIGTMLVMILFSQYLKDVGIPVPTYSGGRVQIKRFYAFKLFPVLLTILFMWGICAILTYVSNGYEDPESAPLQPGNKARTDIKLNVIYGSYWFRHPYPFQWGWPTVSAAGVFGMFAGIFAGVVESIGDYYACARLAGAPPPPKHAVNRGIAVEGLGCLIAGIFGTGNGTTSYSENIGAIGVTKVGSRRVVQFGALCMIFLGLFSKLGAVFATVPDPIVGGIFYVMFGMVTAVGLSSLQFVDLNSTRNLFVLGFSLFFSLAFPKWLSGEGKDSLNPEKMFDDYETFSESKKEALTVVFQIIAVLLKTNMFVAALLGCFLDNTIPGTPEERGVEVWKKVIDPDEDENDDGSAGDNKLSCYDFPFGMSKIRKIKWLRHFPVSPTFTGFQFRNKVLPITSVQNGQQTNGKNV